MTGADELRAEDVSYIQYGGEERLQTVMNLIDNELSEPYSMFTYRYFLRNWPQLCFIAYHGSNALGTIVCKMDKHKDETRGYIAMLVVEKPYRKLGIGSRLVASAIDEMKSKGASEIVLEAEITNHGALNLYQNLGFIRDKRLHRYYLSGMDAFRLKLLFPRPKDNGQPPPGMVPLEALPAHANQEDVQSNAAPAPVT